MAQSFTLHQIGTVHSEYEKKYHAPRQPRVDDRLGVATIQLEAHQNFEQALKDLDGFEHLWIISLMHQTEGWKPLVLPPRSDKKRGVFATRSPHRPNPVAISVVELVRIRGLEIDVLGCDLLHGTPVLDIKPYLPYADSVPKSAAGWVDELSNADFEVAGLHLVPAEVRNHVQRVLATSPFPHPYKRIRLNAAGELELGVQELRVCFVVSEQQVQILRCYNNSTQQH